MARLAARSNDKKHEYPKKDVKDLQKGDDVIVKGMRFVLYGVDNTKNGYCLYDKYGDDYYIGKTEQVEVVHSVDDVE